MKAKKIHEVYHCPYCGYSCSRISIYKQNAIYAPLSHYPHFFNSEGLPKTLQITLSSETLIEEKNFAPIGEFSTIYLNLGGNPPSRYAIGYMCPKCKNITDLNAREENIDLSYEYI